MNRLVSSTSRSLQRSPFASALNQTFLATQTSFSSPPSKRHLLGGRIVIIGSGWAGFKLLEDIDQQNYDIVVVSPRNHFVFTPLLASTSVGTLEFRCISEPVRGQAKKSGHLQFYEANVTGIDLLSKRINCESVLERGGEDREVAEKSAGGTFSLGYDKLVIACGALPNTFNIPGVQKYAHFLKEIQDARRIRYRIMECFEQANQPGMTQEKIEQLLHFVVVGGGPTGVEFSAELHDFIKEDLSRLYRHLMPHVKMTLFDVAPKILSMFDSSLSDYTSAKFDREGIKIRTGSSVVKVEEKSLTLKDGETVPYGLLVWSTGLAPNPLLQQLQFVRRDARSGRLFTDEKLRVINDQPLPLVASKNAEDAAGKPNVLQDVFALGDCGTILGNDMPCTAQVAAQKAKYLASILNKSVQMIPIDQAKPFSYRDLGTLAYVGGWKAIAGVPVTSTKKWNESGVFAWLLWRSAYFTMSVSWKNKALIPIYWVLTWIFGRDITHLK